MYARVMPLDRGSDKVRTRAGDEQDLVEVLSATRGLLKESILPRLRESIVEGELTPGTRLSEAEISRRLGVSRTPIREALSALRAEGLVDIRPHVGTFVRPLRPDQVRGLYQVRMALEELAAREAAGTMTEPSRVALKDGMEKMRRAVESGEHREYATQMDVFHHQILVGSGNESLVRAYESLAGTARQIRRITLRHRGRIETSLTHHLGIGEAVVAGNGDLAAQRMHGHLEDAVSVVQVVIEETFRSALGTL